MPRTLPHKTGIVKNPKARPGSHFQLRILRPELRQRSFCRIRAQLLFSRSKFWRQTPGSGPCLLPERLVYAILNNLMKTWITWWDRTFSVNLGTLWSTWQMSTWSQNCILSSQKLLYCFEKTFFFFISIFFLQKRYLRHDTTHSITVYLHRFMSLLGQL